MAEASYRSEGLAEPPNVNCDCSGRWSCGWLLLTSLSMLFLYFPSFLEFNECALAFNQKLVKELKKKMFLWGLLVFQHCDVERGAVNTWTSWSQPSRLGVPAWGLQLGVPGCPVPDTCGCLALHAVPLSSSLQSALPQACWLSYSLHPELGRTRPHPAQGSQCQAKARSGPVMTFSQVHRQMGKITMVNFFFLFFSWFQIFPV